VSSPDCYLDPGEQVSSAPTRVFACGLRGIAIKLLPHLREAVHRAGGVGVIGQRRRSQLERPRRKVLHVWDACIWNVVRKAGSPGRQENVVVLWKTVLVGFGGSDGREGCRKSIRSTRGRAPPVSGGGRIEYAALPGGLNWKPSLALSTADAWLARKKFRPRVPSSSTIPFDSRLSMRSLCLLVCGEHMIESPVLPDNNDHMLDGSLCFG
jgi:hypothetical protein